MWDEATNGPKMPMGSVGHRWGETQGKWNLLLQDGADGSLIDPRLTFLEDHDGVVQVDLDNFGLGDSHARGVPVKRLTTATGEQVTVTTVYDLLMAQYGCQPRLGRGVSHRLRRR